MKDIKDNLAKDLSEGQKRKLTFGIAILGDPQVSGIMYGKESRLSVHKTSNFLPLTVVDLSLYVSRENLPYLNYEHEYIGDGCLYNYYNLPEFYCFPCYHVKIVNMRES